MVERSSFASCCRVPSQINWVLDGLRRRRFDDIQASRAPKAKLIARTASVAIRMVCSLCGHQTHNVKYHKCLESCLTCFKVIVDNLDDNNRVVLSQVGGVALSDYINASVIK